MQPRVFIAGCRTRPRGRRMARRRREGETKEPTRGGQRDPRKHCGRWGGQAGVPSALTAVLCVERTPQGAGGNAVGAEGLQPARGRVSRLCRGSGDGLVPKSRPRLRPPGARVGPARAPRLSRVIAPPLFRASSPPRANSGPRSLSPARARPPLSQSSQRALGGPTRRELNARDQASSAAAC